MYIFETLPFAQNTKVLCQLLFTATEQAFNLQTDLGSLHETNNHGSGESSDNFQISFQSLTFLSNFTL